MDKKRVVNINFKCDGLDFDAAIDCNNVLKESLGHEYLPEETSEYRTNIELYCFDRHWGERFIHYEGETGVVVNDREPDVFGHYHTVCNIDEIIAAAREWIKEEEDKEDAKFEKEPWFVSCCKECTYRRPILDGRRCYCHILYNLNKAETNCWLVKKWLETRKTEK